MQFKSRALALAGALLFTLPFFNCVQNVAIAEDGLLEDPVLKARRMFEARQYKECLEFVEPQALGPEKINPALQFYYAMLLRHFGRKEEAIERFELVLKMAPFGWMETRSKEALRELRDAPKSNAHYRLEGQEGFTGMKVKDNQIMQVLSGSAAEKARLAPGDKIVSIDGVATTGMDSDTVARRIRGIIGSPVKLVVERGGKQYSANVVRTVLDAPVSAAGVSGGARTSSNAAGSAAPALDRPSSSASQAKPVGDKSAKLSGDDPPIEILRHTNDTDAIYQEMVTTILMMPRSIRSDLNSFGVKVMLTPTMLDALPDMATERPRGYSHGGTFVNCGGLYKGAAKTLYVTERVQIGNHVASPNIRLSHTVLHEFGHAYDHCKQITRSEDFLSSYQSDSGRLTNTLREHFYYYTQADEAGPSELFAQLFMCAVSPAGTVNTNDQNLTRTFPKCYELVKKIVSRAY
jgi:membrane-associated protease RseP (regulator of RpoE activity)